MHALKNKTEYILEALRDTLFSGVLLMATLCVLFFAPALALAQSIEVDFEQTPLFQYGNIVPGDSYTHSVSVKNTSGETQDVYVKAINGFSVGSLASQLRFSVEEGAQTPIDDISLAEFLDGVERLLTANLANGANASYLFTISFPESAGNEYQGSSAGFDFCIGFSGGTHDCISDDPDDPTSPTPGPGSGSTPTSGGGGGGGGGGIIPSSPLTIFNERAQNITSSGTADIVWNTNRDASRRVVFGPLSGGPYSLNIFLPHYGYPQGTNEILSPLLSAHTVPLSGLTPGATYVYRVMSRESGTDFITLSPEYRFTVPLTGTISITPSTPPTSTLPPGDVLGTGTGTTGVGTGATGTGGASAGVGGGGFIGVDDGGDSVIGDTTAGDGEGTPEDGAGGDVAGFFPDSDSQIAGALFGIPGFLDDLFLFSECALEWISALILFLGLMFSTMWGRILSLQNPSERRFRRFFVLSGLGILAATMSILLGYGEMMYGLALLFVLALVAGALDWFTFPGLLPHARMTRISLVYVIGVLVGALIAFIFGFICYIWPLLFVALGMALRGAFVRVNNKN